MIAIDTSALLAIVLREPEADRFSRLIDAHGRALIGTPTLLEFRLVAFGKLEAEIATEVVRLVDGPPFEPVPFGPDHLAAATDALRRFGKGRHPASLNFGDCMAYAVAAVAGCPLLFKGEDFPQTDIGRVG